MWDERAEVLCFKYDETVTFKFPKTVISISNLFIYDFT